MALVQRHSLGSLGSTVQGHSLGVLATVPRQSSRRLSVVRNSYEVDTDTPPKAPNTAPGRWGAPPPPPPPPPPPLKTGGAAPSRREAIAGLLGAALGAGVTTAYFKVQYPDDEESLAAALDELLDNPDFLDAVTDELMYQEFEAENDENNAALSRMRNALAAEVDPQEGQ